MSAGEWFIRRDAVTLGPFSTEELLRHVVRGRVGPMDRIRAGAEGEWIPAMDVAILSSVFSDARKRLRPSMPPRASAPPGRGSVPPGQGSLSPGRASLPPLPGAGEPPEDGEIAPVAAAFAEFKRRASQPPPAAGESEATPAAAGSAVRIRRWFIDRAGTPQGPCTLQELRDALAHGDLRLEDRLCEVGSQAWRPAGELEGLVPPAGDSG